MQVKRKAVVSWTIVATVLGVMMSVQYHDVLLGGAAIWSALPDVGAVTDRLNAVTDYNGGLQRRIQRVESQVLFLQNKALNSGGAVAQIERQISAAKILAGSTSVTGPGVVVTIDDGKMSKRDYQQFITHDWDLRSVINELFAAGADAVAVNQVRITAATGVFCVGPVVNVGGIRLGPPFVVQAIGNPTVLAAALNLPGGVLDVLRGTNRGLSVSQPARRDRIKLPAYAAPLTAEQGGSGA